MDMDEARIEMEGLFWGAMASVDTEGIVPAGTEPMGIATALTRALAVVYHYEITEVRATLRRVQAAMPNGVTNLIRDETARLDRLEVEVDRMVSEMR